MANPVTDPWSSGSYGTSGNLSGEIVSINDPLRRNRVQVRIHGYQNDQGTIPDSDLMWVATVSSSSQIAGASSTHNFYPGARVILGMIGTEMHVLGATAGFDSDKRKDQGTGGSSTDPDVPRQVQGKGNASAQATDGTGKDTTEPTSRNPRTGKPLEKPQEVDAYQDSRDKAPFKKGEKAKKYDDKSIGNLKNTQGGDILDIIKGMDGNASGAIKEGVDLIKKLRSAAFGTSQEMIGSSSMIQAANQFQKDFGTPPGLNLLPLIQELITCQKLVNSSTLPDLDIRRCASALRPPVLGVSSDIVEGLEQEPILLDTIRNLYSTGLNQALSGITRELNQAASIAGGPGELIGLFSDPRTFLDTVMGTTALGSSIGTAREGLASVGAGAFAIAYQGIDAIARASVRTPNAIGAALNVFASNPVAKAEMAGSGINPESLLKIPLKYAKKRVNDPAQVFNSLLGGK